MRLQVVRGEVSVDRLQLVEGDGLGVTPTQAIDIIGVTDEADIILFDLARGGAMSSNRPRPKRTPSLDAYVKLMRAAGSVTAQLEGGLRESGLTTSQFGVLEALYHLGPLTQGDLARKLLKSSGNLTLVVDNLERRGLAKRRKDAKDRRCVEVHLTTSGKRLISEVYPRHARAIRHAMGALAPYELRHLAELCRRLGLAAAQERATR